MALPTIDVPTYSLTVPSTGAAVKFRPFLVKENKLLLLANASESLDDMYRTIGQIIQNCTFGQLNPEKLTIFDVQYIFLKIRSKSVGEVAEFSVECSACKEAVPVQINLEEVQIKKNPKNNPKIQLTDKVGLIMKYPTLQSEKIAQSATSDADREIELIISCIECVYDATETYEAKSQSREELRGLIEQLTTENYNKINQFFETLPGIAHEVPYTCKCGHKDKIVVEKLNDFFE